MVYMYLNNIFDGFTLKIKYLKIRFSTKILVPIEHYNVIQNVIINND